MTRNPDILFITEYIKNVLYFATVKQGKVQNNTASTHYFSIDNDLVYENYYSDFGPLNLSCVYKYCKILNEKLKQYLNKQVIIHYTSVDPKKKANAAFLLACFGVLYLSLSPRDALKPLFVHGQSYKPFQDAIQGDSAFTISLLDCIQAIKKARDLGFFNFQDFNHEDYDRFNTIQGGDLNWIIPGKFLAFIGPVDYSVSLYHPPEMYISYFLNNNVNVVIRLNKRSYDSNVFSNVGINHYDLFFPDGSCPPRHILFKFLQISEDTNTAIAVHCKAGLGRTGSLIGCYLIKHYRMTSHEAIGWMRICRPGSVIGHQQGWLEKLEPWLMKQGNFYRKRLFQDTEKFPCHHYGVYSIAEKNLKKGIIFQEPMSPSPPMRRQTRSDISPPVRPQASKIREVPNKASEKETSGRNVRSSKLNNIEKNLHKGDQNNASPSVSRRGSGAGEPRVVCLSPRGCTSFQSHRSSSKSNETTTSTKIYSPVPTFRTTQGPVIKTIDDARNFLMRSSTYNDDREKQLNTFLRVTPRYTMESSQYPYDQKKSSPVKRTIPSSYSTASRIPTQPNQRRRLGRSPSPPPLRNEQTRATNTLILAENSIMRDGFKTALPEALSRLKLCSGRDGSLGAASLGARRDAPAPKWSPSVHSDERALATQGDMLNSIKLQRTLRDTLNSDKFKSLFRDKKCAEMTITKNNPGSVTVRKPGVYPEVSCSKERSSIQRSFFGPTRPSSPKARRTSINIHSVRH